MKHLITLLESNEDILSEEDLSTICSFVEFTISKRACNLIMEPTLIKTVQEQSETNS